MCDHGQPSPQFSAATERQWVIELPDHTHAALRLSWAVRDDATPPILPNSSADSLPLGEHLPKERQHELVMTPATMLVNACQHVIPRRGAMALS